MKKLKDIFLLARKTVLDPSGAAADLLAPGAGLGGPLAIYLVYCAAYALFLYMKPADFPAELAQAGLEFSGRSYAWFFSVLTASELVFTGVFCAVFSAFSGLMKDGRLAFRFFLGCLICGSCAAAAFHFRSAPLFSLPFLAAVIAAAGAGVYAQKAAAAAFFRFSLSCNAVVLICLPVSFLAAALRSETLYLAAEAAAGLWLTVLVIKAAKILFGGTIARIAPVLLFSFLTSILSFYVLRNLGVITPEIFKFMLFM
ncbi:MAG: hypothetical protein A2X28_05300 [Elusimicrobia bacterium GWA2_56_46]|nr:MAG: hypothetical protein A2X28_05300 [Elusimicrobia bacterium GWA2_56_46]OGR55278.1 MAG: hypothetical protein A2X39_04465 [Elusimicrobia bacterium GWC2_56_31]HBB66578.1 hypothetical protein [Elusimicrobiota bacterium]HBW23509.1 hypothetical protein [Elusimicrobiota bacterium]